LYRYLSPRDQHSFPTRRASDLRKSSKGYRQGYPFAHYSAVSLPSSCWLFSASSPSSTVSIIPRPTATYLIIFNAFPGNLIGANSTNCTAWLIFLIIFFIFSFYFLYPFNTI